MVFFNYSTMQMAAKVVYYGPGLCGKTTNLQHIYDRTSSESRGEMVSLETETDRTLFFDLLPIDVGSIAGFNTRIQLYTVPGQVFYNTTRKLVLKGVDGVVFVADSQRTMKAANVASFKNLEENLAEMGMTLESLPLVLQFNKRDLPDICTVEELNEALNAHGWPWYEASAIEGRGVFETLKGVSKATLVSLRERLTRGPGGEAPAPVPAPGPAPSAAASPAPSAPAAPPPPAAAPPEAEPAAAPASPAPPAAAAAASARRPAVRRSGGRDALDELERLRRETVRGSRLPGSRPGLTNGRGELSRRLEVALTRPEFERIRRVKVHLEVEDADEQVVEEIRGYSVDVDDPKSLGELLLKLHIALSTRG